MSTIRHCSRCYRELTDAVSLTLGVGPICRGIDNEVYAKTIGVDDAKVRAASARLVALLHKLAPETQPVMVTVFQECMSTGRAADMRATVKRIDWCLSYAQPREVMELLIELVVGLGYVGLAGVLGQRSSTTPAELGVMTGRITVKGSKNSYAASLIKKIPGWKFDYPTKTWSVPAVQHEALFSVVSLAYPATKVTAAELEVFAIRALSMVPEAVAPSAPALVQETVAPVAVAPAAPPAVCPVTVVSENGKLIVRTAAYFPHFVAELKTLFWKDRAWNLPSAPKAWTVAPQHLEFVENLITKHFPLAKAA